MRANANTVSQLYQNTCALSYTETSMSRNPRMPFNTTNEDSLLSHADQLANVAKDFRQSNGDTLDQQAVDQAFTQVNLTQTMFDVINQRISNAYTVQSVMEAADKSIASIEAILPQSV